ncbi:MAG: M13 family metallopeptidase N-terminal domain-containing protein, partial [Pseudomonadota bacterium]
MYKTLIALASFGALAACAPATTPDETSIEQTAPAAKAAFGEFGLDLETVAQDTAPGDDFFRHVNGVWLDTFEIPADKSRYGVFTLLSDRSEAQVRAIIEDTAAAAPDPGSLEGMIANYYNAFMAESVIEDKGLAPLAPYLERIENANTREDLAALFAANGYIAPFGGWVDIDSKQTDRYIFYVTQAGLGLPDRSYYLDDNERFAEIRGQYVDFLETMLGFAGYEDPRVAAERVMALETQMAEIHWDRAKRRDRDLTYNLTSREDFAALATDFPIETMLVELGLGDQSEFVLREKDAIA